MDRELTEEQAATFQDAIERLRRGFDQGGRYLAPQDAATAQVKYDCWIEATEDGRSDDADACKAAFESAMAALESQANYALTDIEERTSGVTGKRVSVRVDLGGCRISKKKKKQNKT